MKKPMTFKEFVMKINENHGVKLDTTTNRFLVEEYKSWWSPLSEGKYYAPGKKEVKIMLPIENNRYATFNLTKEDIYALLKSFENK